MIHLVYLAAGNGKRFGSNKLLADLRGIPLWRYGYETLKKVRDTFDAKLYVISRYTEILESVGMAGVYSPDSEKGKSYSIKTACSAIGEVSNDDKVLFLTADQPEITEKTIIDLLKTELSSNEAKNGPLIACVSDGENDGNPVVFSACLIPELAKLTGDKGGKSIFFLYQKRIARVFTNSKELRDVDTIGDLSAIY